MRALAKLDVSNNGLYAAGGKVLAEAFSGNQVMTELNFANNKLGLQGDADMDAIDNGGDADMSGIIALTDAILGMGTLSTVIMHKFPLPIQDIQTRAELDFSGKELCFLDAFVIAALLPLNVSGKYLLYYR
jgi:hypothetical protein